MFPEKISPYFKKLIKIADDPAALLTQVRYTKAEQIEKEAFVSSPVADWRFKKSTGVIQKYKNRILIIFSGVCPSHCRYCFRKNFPYEQELFDIKDIAKIKRLCDADFEVEEIIISGGEPLSASDEQFRELIVELEQIKQINTIRIHSRMLAFAPHRFESWLALWTGTNKKLVFITHFNHRDELSPAIQPIIKHMRQIGFTLLNQAVLLKNVNDNLTSLTALSKSLFSYGILPYYLHQLDRVKGAHHFEVSLEKGKYLMKKLQARLPGYLMPRYVREIP